MASIQHLRPSVVANTTPPEPPTSRPLSSRAAAYTRHQLQATRAELSGGAAARASRTPSVTRPSRAAPHSADQIALSSSFNGASNMRGMHHSNHGEYTSKPNNGNTAAAPAVHLGRLQSVQSQPLPKTPGTPGMTRARMLIGSNGVMRPMATPATMGSSISLTTSPTRGTYSMATASAAAATLPADDVLCKIFGSCLPTVFESLAKFQYQQATHALVAFGEEIENDESGARDVRLEWRSWDAFTVMVRLTASCESSYHLMRYLEPDMLHKETLDQLYNKLVVLLNHLVDEVQPVLKRAQQRSIRAEKKNTPVSGRRSSEEIHSVTSEEALQSELDRLTLDDLEYYHGLLFQASEFFALRVSMVELYRGLATQPPPHKYSGMAKTLDRMIKRYAQFEHPLLAVLKQSAIEELRTVKAAFESEIAMAQYDFTKSMVALHRFKVSLRLWSDHIDSVSEYPLFDESDEDDDYMLSGSTYSNNNSADSSTFQTQHHVGASLLNTDSMYSGYDVPPPPTGSLPRPQRESSFRRKSFTSGLASASEMAAFAAASEQAIAAAAAEASTPTEPQSTFSRLIAQRGSLLKRGLSVASLRSKIQTPSTSLPPATPTNTLEHAILGTTPSVVNGAGVSSSLLTPVGNGLSSVGAGGTSGFNTTNSHTLAAEMMASAVAKQEREDGYALPVYQWSKRFYRSLVAKFTLYFHRWLEPFESRGDALSPYDLTRFIRSPVGISYLQLIDVLLAKGSHRTEDGFASIMLILETEKLDNKGAKFYANGYLCPGFSHRETVGMEVPTTKKMGYAAKAASRSGLVRPAPSTGGTTAPLSSSSSGGSSQSHSLFNLNVDPEAEDEENGDFAPLWGLRGWPAVFCYPQQEAPLHHWPNIISLIMDNRHVLEIQSGRGPFVHTERRLKASYYIMSVDPAVYLVLLLEGKRRPSEKTAQDFMQTMAENLQHIGVYRRGGTASVTKC